MSIWVILKSLKEELPSKGKFYSSLTDRKISDKEYEYVLNVREKIEMKTMKDNHDLYQTKMILRIWVKNLIKTN